MSPTDLPPPSPTAANAPPRWRRLLAPLVQGSTYRATLYHLINLPLGILSFVVFVTMLSTSTGLAITFVGIPLLLATIGLGRVLGALERARAHTLLGGEYRAKPMPDWNGTWWDRFKRAIGDRPGWMGIGYGLVMLPWGIVTFTVTVTLWGIALGGLTSWMYVPFSHIEINGFVVERGSRVAYTAAGMLVGAIALVATPWVIQRIAQVDRWLVRTLLSQTRTEELETRVTELTQSRDASLDSAAAELRRIERDLHDGAQQRLVALAMDLGLARERLASGADPQRAAELVGRAHDEAKQAIGELRDLVRGIHPSVLTDRGLDAALSALAARSPIPVAVEVDLPDGRPPAPIEAAAYFVVAEALTNVAKHSRAATAWVRVSRRDTPGSATPRLVVEVGDDGMGGAEIQPGGGLAGLRDRVLAVEGRLRIASPVGGPTMLVGELPCGS